MEPGPLPPHERTWRHPSELAAEERALVQAERTPRGAKVMAFASGTAGLLAVGLFLVSVAPGPADAPIAIATTSTPSAATPRAVVGATVSRDDVRAFRGDPSALATPIGDGTFAVVTRASLSAADSTVVEVRLPSGRRSLGSIVTASESAVVVALAETESGHPIARERPGAGDVVTVMAVPPVEVAFADVDELSVDEGTPVLDGDGHLVGICSRKSDGETELIELSDALDDATSVVP